MPLKESTALEDDPSAPPVIRAEGLVKHFGRVRAVDGVSLAVGRGEVAGLVGPNGAGKSTTLKLLTGALEPDAGRVVIAGHPMRGLAARACLGYLPERTPLYVGMRVDRYLEHVARVRGLGASARRAALERVLAACGLEDHATRRIRTLSKGYRQRVGLAQALVADPEVLVLDEPTSGLDPIEIVRIRELVRELSRTKTILLSTHVLGEVEEICDRAILVAGGEVVADGTLEELCAGDSPRASLVVMAEREDAERSLRELECVRAVAFEGAGAGGALRFCVEVDERWEGARHLGDLARRRGWSVLELRHETSSLERVFVERTRRAFAARSAGGGHDADAGGAA